MKDYQNLAHVQWECKYYIAWGTRIRNSHLRKVLIGIDGTCAKTVPYLLVRHSKTGQHISIE